MSDIFTCREFLTNSFPFEWMIERIIGGCIYSVSSLKDDNDGDQWQVIPYCNSSDYTGSDIGLANYNHINNEHGENPYIAFIYGDYGYKDVIYNISAHIRYKILEMWGMEQEDPDMDALTEILAIVNKDGDPTLDDYAYYQTQNDLKDEAWESWIRFDFTKSIENEHKIELDDLSDSQMRELFEKCIESANDQCFYAEWINEGNNTIWIDVNKVVNGFNPAMLKEI